MKKIILYALLLFLIPLSMSAQSSMTDEQVMRFVAKEHKAGTSNAQIVTKLVQNGVDISQIRRVRKKYERQMLACAATTARRKRHSTPTFT